MNPQISQEIQFLQDMLADQNEVGIVVGAHQTVDTMAGALAFYLSLSQSGKRAQIVSLKDPIVELSSLVGINKVQKSFLGNTTKLVVSLPYKKGEVEKVLFTEAPSTINFHLTAVEGKSITPFDMKDVKLNWEGGAPGFIIAVGVGTIDELSQIIDANNTKIVNIDNYPQNTRFGDVVIVDESFSSISEIVGKILKDLNFLLDRDSAQNLLDGVLFATRNFTKPNTSPLAFETTSAAMYQGAQRRDNRDNRGPQQPQQSQGQRPNNQNQQPQAQPRQRVGENDFPAMHMQNRPQNNPQMPPRRPQPDRNMRPNPPMPRPQQSQGQQPQGHMNAQDIINKIRQEAPARQPEPQVEPIYEEGQFDPMPQDNPQPMEENVMPFSAQPPFPSQPQDEPDMPQSNEDVPDDWLMPKVFKSSKNQN